MKQILYLATIIRTSIIMKQIALLFGVLIIALIGCDKKDNPPEVKSYWTVNNDTIAFRTIFIRTAPLLTELRVVSLPVANNSLSITFGKGYLPHSGTYKVDHIGSDSSTMSVVYVTYNGFNYDVNSSHNTTTIKVSTLSNGKALFELEPTWFYKQPTLSDSILVKGVIVEPD